jgi:hypothetical protein
MPTRCFGQHCCTPITLRRINTPLCSYFTDIMHMAPHVFVMYSNDFRPSNTVQSSFILCHYRGVPLDFEGKYPRAYCNRYFSSRFLQDQSVNLWGATYPRISIPRQSEGGSSGTPSEERKTTFFGVSPVPALRNSSGTPSGTY